MHWLLILIEIESQQHQALKRLLACLPCWCPTQLSSHLAAKHQGVLLRAGHRVDQPTAIWQVRQQVLPIANDISQLLACCLATGWGKLLEIKSMCLCSLLKGLQSSRHTKSVIWRQMVCTGSRVWAHPAAGSVG